MARLVHPVILSGGSGTRLWPLSRADHPKQLLALLGERTLFQATVERVRDRARFEAPVIVCSEDHRFMVRDQLAALGVEAAAIILEPTARNTAPAACMAAMWIARTEPQALLLLLPSDHTIEGPDGYAAALQAAAAAAEQGQIGLFGVRPNRAETGYGYIVPGPEIAGAPGAYAVGSFVEKPAAAEAEALVTGGAALWNSGMFLMRADVLLEEMKRFEPRILEGCTRAFESMTRDLEFLRIVPEHFGTVPKRSIDNAVMERTRRAAVVPAAFSWSDVGAWSALWDMAGKDADGNVCVGDVRSVGARNCYARSAKRLVTLVGVEDLVVVETADAVLVTRKDRTQEVKDLVAALIRDGRSEAYVHARTYRPWGYFETVDLGDGFKVKHLQVLPGHKLSLQKHHHRAEHWVVVAGTARIVLGEETRKLAPNESAYIPIGCVHRLENPANQPLDIIEVQTGGYLEEDDIVRLSDAYGRAP
jgi:mannose-1-phosphate guanylyltransferase/mannose-6-phosphate isomerase